MPMIGSCTQAKIPASAGGDFADVLGERYREGGSIDGPVHAAPEDSSIPKLEIWLPVETRKTILICDDEPALRELVITAWNETREDVLAAGATDFVAKPFDPDELKAAIEQILRAA